MKTNYKTLIVEDHVLTAHGIKRVLTKITETTGTTFKFHFASKCSQAITILKSEPLIDLVFLDIKLPKEPEIGMFSGKDLGVKIRKLYPNAQIIVLTAYNQPIIIIRIIDEIAPEGLLVKGDTKVEELVSGIERALRNPPYYSSTVMEIITNRVSSSLKLDKLDIQLLTELNKGHTLKIIGELISISQSAVSKRKRKLKLRFGVPDGNDRDLIKKALLLGVI